MLKTLPKPRAPPSLSSPAPEARGTHALGQHLIVVVPRLVDMGCVAAIDAVMLEEMCRWLAPNRELSQDLSGWEQTTEVDAIDSREPPDRISLTIDQVKP